MASTRIVLYIDSLCAAQDNGGTARGGSDNTSVRALEIRIVPVNNAPSFQMIIRHALLCSDRRHFSGHAATNITAGPLEENQTLSFEVQVVSEVSHLFDELPTVSSNGTLSFATTATRSSSARVAAFNVTLLDDGGTYGGGANRSSSVTFSVTIEAYLEHSLSTLVYTLDEDTSPAFVQLLVCPHL